MNIGERTDTAVPFLRNGNLGGASYTRYLPSIRCAITRLLLL